MSDNAAVVLMGADDGGNIFVNGTGSCAKLLDFRGYRFTSGQPCSQARGDPARDAKGMEKGYELEMSALRSGLSAGQSTSRLRSR
jgi:hypothetical protein